MKKYLAAIALAACAATAQAGDDYYLQRVRQQLQFDDIQRQTKAINNQNNQLIELDMRLAQIQQQNARIERQLRDEERAKELNAIMRSPDPQQAMVEAIFFGVRH